MNLLRVRREKKVNIDIAQCVMIFCFVFFFFVLNSVKAAKVIHALQRETDELRNQLKLDLDNMYISIDCLEKKL